MPSIHLSTNLKIKDSSRLQSLLAQSITLLPGKTPERVMLTLSDEQKMYFAGSDEPCVMAAVQVNNKMDHEILQNYGQKLIDLISGELTVPATRIFVTCACIEDWFSRKA